MMHSRSRFRVTRAMLVRMLADAAMINVALVVALGLRFLIEFAAGEHRDVAQYEAALWSYIAAYWHNAAILTLLCLAIFAISGFYTYGRSYQGKYKAFVITQAVIQSYLIFGVSEYLLWDTLGLIQIPRGALLLAFGMNLGLTLASRSWAVLWERVVRPEREQAIRRIERPVRRVLVIGGAGYIGSALLPILLGRGHRVRVLDLFLYGTEPIEKVKDHPRLELLRGDFRHVQKVVEAMRDVDAVVHLGAIVGDPACDLDERLTIDVNLSATRMIAQVAKASGVRRFVFASTCSVYGANDDVLDEHSEVRPISLYGTTKLAAERGLQSMADDGFQPTILRFATIYGLSGRTRFDLVVNLLAAKAKIDGLITIHGGDQWRPFVHVEDAALAVACALERPLELVGNQIFNIGSDEQNRTIREVGELIYEHVVGAKLVINEDVDDRRNYRVSFQKARNILGFKPRWTIEQGIEQVVEAVVSGAVRDYRDPRFSNVRFLSESGAIELIRVDDDWSRQILPIQREPQLTR